jgi:hypothetical protein
MRNPQEYRNRARECVELAQVAKSDRALLLQIANSWLKLADQVDGEERLLENSGVASYFAARH